LLPGVRKNIVRSKDFDRAIELKRIPTPPLGNTRRLYDSIPDDEPDEIADLIFYSLDEQRAVIRKL